MNQIKIMGHIFSRNTKTGEAVDERSLYAAQDAVDFLIKNVRDDGIFRMTGRSQTRRKILTALIRADRVGLQQLLKIDSVIEIAAALQLYIQCLKQPIIPVRVQQLLIADNPGIPEEMIANDALGLLYQDLSGPHLKLLTSLLALLKSLNNSAHRTELTSFSLPIALLPTFFNIKQPWTRKWHQVAVTFNELIMRAPQYTNNMETSNYNLHAGSWSYHTIGRVVPAFSLFQPRNNQSSPIIVA